jgi:hypothetical protein
MSVMKNKILGIVGIVLMLIGIFMVAFSQGISTPIDKYIPSKQEPIVLPKDEFDEVVNESSGSSNTEMVFVYTLDGNYYLFNSPQIDPKYSYVGTYDIDPETFDTSQEPWAEPSSDGSSDTSEPPGGPGGHFGMPISVFGGNGGVDSFIFGLVFIGLGIFLVWRF